MGLNDRELLEKAAKAAGYTGVISFGGDVGVMAPCNPVGTSKFQRWNPLTDDGDALRLAVKLRISLTHQQEYMGGPVLEFIESKTQHTASHFPKSFEECFTETDEMAATRRAIVRAASSIGGELT